MRIAYASDLHMEFGNPFVTDGLDGADVLVLAGDVETHAGEWAYFLRRVSESFGHKPIIVVMGNHEYYHGVYPDDLDRYLRALADLQLPNIHLLERESVVIDGVRFLGATLWTDFAKGTQAMSCQLGMADFVVIRDGDTMIGLSAQRIDQDHKDTVAWLKACFHDNWRGSNVVVTHHAPSFRSSHPRFADSRITGGFCSDLDSLIGAWKPDLWIHGHVHDPMDYRIGKTRVLCNPWGYPDERNERVFLTAETGCPKDVTGGAFPE
ncbi:metallophosphoesterase [Acidithiobacillus ferridurans]|uniref:Phosphatase n=1 Tax=Acidithiobacillus ferridurans TaxID=1232575 RepID=A0A8X8GFK3_ACIFI|nr:metallophosphoesterase [Acidithiobacillus ferridurans]MBU2714592.1 phosphatase [Acidithiobacillus ferridurans]MBU2724786.1 phosphatase [Acidithiobacillus ferridurans]MBU2726315.1 phosphatase [Acidithiobacillus ferridurans]